MAERALIVGIDSMIGGAVAAHLHRSGLEVVGTSRRRANPDHLYLDLTDDMSRWQIPEGIAFAGVFAGVTALKDCDADPDGSRLVNVTSTLTLIERLISRGIYVMYPSSNLVFSGAGDFDEATPQSPKTEYGRQKVDVERGLYNSRGGASIVRFTKVLPPHFDLFVRWKRVLESGGEVHPFDDLMFAPVTLHYCASVVGAICQGRHTGIFHVSGSESISYADAARHIARRVRADPERIRPVSGKEAGVGTDRIPKEGALLTHRLDKELGIARADVWQSIDESLDWSTGGVSVCTA